jgi:cyclopropane fatty-acyl-phospholipid synthase-like methyltransferase
VSGYRDLPRDWKAWWNTSEAVQSPDSYRQVGRTVSGVATGDADPASVCDAIVEALALTGTETLLDLCCGNGLVTSLVAAHCRHVVAVDYSAPLIGAARLHHARGNVDYVVADVSRLDAVAVDLSQTDAAYMSLAFQYFDSDKARALLASLRAVVPPRCRLFLEDIPDAARLFDFYNTPERQAEYRRRIADGTEAIGHWWSADDLVRLAASEGFDCRIITQPAQRFRTHYRFDAMLRPRGCPP